MKIEVKLGASALRTCKLEAGDPLRLLIRTDGTFRVLTVPRSYRELVTMIAADTTDTVTLADGEHVMLVDDLAQPKNLPMNPLATALYWEKCGGQVDHVIKGDVVVMPDEDFA